MEQVNEHDLKYLEAELARIDLLIRREVRRWVLAGQDPNDDYRGLYVTQAAAEQLLERPFGVSWGQLVKLSPEEETAFAQAQSIAQQHIDELASQMKKAGQTPRLHELAQAFGLDRTEMDILLLCLAPALDTRYERLYGYLQDNVMRRRPSVRLMIDLLNGVGVAQSVLVSHLQPAASLFQHRLVEMIVEAPPANAHWINQTLQVDETVVAWLLGHYIPHASLGRSATLVWPIADEALSYLLDDLTQPIAHLAADQAEQQPVVVLYGHDNLRQQAVAYELAILAGKPLLIVDLNQAVNEQNPALSIIEMALRDALITGAIPYLKHGDVCLTGQDGAPVTILSALNDYPGLVVATTAERWQIQGLGRKRHFYWFACQAPSYEQRHRLWRRWLDGSTEADEGATTGETQKMSKEAKERLGRTKQFSTPVDILSGQFLLTSGQIRDAVATAQDSASQAGRMVTDDDLFAAARSICNPRLSALARKIEPRYAWGDIVLPPDQREVLQELVATVRHRSFVLEKWGVGHKLAASAGVTVLFAGPPGTGKTMAAEVIAAALQLDLYKIDLSGVVSKYIGETEKNLERIFSEAANSNAILFFDEADALFGKRSDVKDAHDRYANIEISYLLQRMESYDGVTILATNLRGNLDEAFARRLHFAVDFPFPHADDRLRIWQTLFPPELPRASELDFPWLARRFDLAGGNIRNVIFSAAHLAAANGQVVTMDHLLQGVRRELKKLGRLVDEEDFIPNVN